jgi:hypothetical protein
MLFQQGLDLRRVAEQDQLGIRVPPQRQLGSRNNHRGPVVASHGVERDADFIGHQVTLKAKNARREALQAQWRATIACRIGDTKGMIAAT